MTFSTTISRVPRSTDDPLGDFALCRADRRNDDAPRERDPLQDADHGVDASDIRKIYDPNAPL